MTNREIDVLVAEKVMRLEVIKTKYDYTIGPPDYYDEAGEIKLFNELPSYSTDIAAAWEVVEKLKENNDFELLVDHGQWSFHIYRGSNLVRGYEETAQMAICLAALKAVGVEV